MGMQQSVMLFVIVFAKLQKEGNQCFRPLPMTMLMTLSRRFLLILGPERARRVTWVVARNLAEWAFE